MGFGISTKTAFLIAAGMALAASAHASPGPADDRIMSADAVGWRAVHGVSPADLKATMDANNLRIADLSVDDTDPLVVSAILIRNEGAYRVDGAFFFHGMPLEGAEATFLANGKRPIVLRTYVENGQVLIAGTSVPNTGANHRIFHIRPGNAATVTHQVNDLDNEAGFRPVTIGTFLSPVTGERQYAVIVADRNGEAIKGTISLNISRAALQPGGSTCKDLVDVAPDHNEAMQQNAVFYTGIPRIGGVCAHLVDFDTIFSELFERRVGRMLFDPHYQLHGTGTSDGDLEWVTAEVWNF